MTSEMILPMRTGYMLEYVPRGARRSRKELVSEVVPVKVRVDENMGIALTGGGMHLVTVSEGRLYNYLSMEDPTVDGFRALAAGGRDQIARNGTLFRRNDLLRQGAPSVSVLDAPLRDTIQIREIVSDGAGDGAAHAQRMADQLVVSDGMVYRLSTNVPSMELSVSSKRIWASHKHYNQDHSGYWRSFRCDDRAGADDFVRRHSERIGKSVEMDLKALERMDSSYARWTEKGLEAECTDAWWVIRAADAIARSPLSSTAAAMDLDTGILENFLAIRKILNPYRRDEKTHGKIPHDSTLPDVVTARSMAAGVIEKLSEIREMLGLDVREHSAFLSRKVDFILDEALEHAPGLALDDDDLDALASFGT